MTAYLGIDPGLTGAVTFISGETVQIADIPTVAMDGKGLVRRRVDGRALAAVLRSFVKQPQPILAYMEDVHAIGGSSVQTMGSMMRSVGAIETVIEMLGLQINRLNPRAWKKFYGLGSDKSASLRVARALYPDAPLHLAKHHNRAESLLIAHAGMRGAK